MGKDRLGGKGKSKAGSGSPVVPTLTFVPAPAVSSVTNNNEAGSLTRSETTPRTPRPAGAPCTPQTPTSASRRHSMSHVLPSSNSPEDKTSTHLVNDPKTLDTSGASPFGNLLSNIFSPQKKSSSSESQGKKVRRQLHFTQNQEGKQPKYSTYHAPNSPDHAPMSPPIVPNSSLTPPYSPSPVSKPLPSSSTGFSPPSNYPKSPHQTPHTPVHTRSPGTFFSDLLSPLSLAPMPPISPITPPLPSASRSPIPYGAPPRPFPPHTALSSSSGSNQGYIQPDLRNQRFFSPPPERSSTPLPPSSSSSSRSISESSSSMPSSSSSQPTNIDLVIIREKIIGFITDSKVRGLYYDLKKEAQTWQYFWQLYQMGQLPVDVIFAAINHNSNAGGLLDPKPESGQALHEKQLELSAAIQKYHSALPEKTISEKQKKQYIENVLKRIQSKEVRDPISDWKATGLDGAGHLSANRKLTAYINEVIDDQILGEKYLQNKDNKVQIFLNTIESFNNQVVAFFKKEVAQTTQKKEKLKINSCNIFFELLYRVRSSLVNWYSATCEIYIMSLVFLLRLDTSMTNEEMQEHIMDSLVFQKTENDNPSLQRREEKRKNKLQRTLTGICDIYSDEGEMLYTQKLQAQLHIYQKTKNELAQYLTAILKLKDLYTLLSNGPWQYDNASDKLKELYNITQNSQDAMKEEMKSISFVVTSIAGHYPDIARELLDFLN